ncbi:MAG: metal ABC transporter permease [Planctomycetes bacterium]|nr:metal ABC transporter permease [Planctomycetota bacterium]MBL7146095.1 metal ABC transporter permease [Phycisphaerae bacterium]
MGTILAYFGIHVLKRDIVFINIAVAQVAAIGSIAAHLAFEAEEDALLSYLFSLVCVLLIAAFYAIARRKIVQISIEAVIGISYAITAAGAMFLIGLAPGHAHAEEMLAGKLLWVTKEHIVLCLIVFTAVALCLCIIRKPLSEISQNYEGAVTQGLKVVWWDFMFYGLLGVVITFAVRVTGVVTVFSFLIIPATISALFSANWALRMFIAWTAATVASLGGLLFAYFFDFSVGPAIALFLGMVLTIAAIFSKFHQIHTFGKKAGV